VLFYKIKVVCMWGVLWGMKVTFVFILFSDFVWRGCVCVCVVLCGVVFLF